MSRLLLLLLSAGALAVNAQSVSVWVTTATQTKKLQQQSPVAFVEGAGGNNPVVIDETKKYQQVEGFGASMTDSAAYLLNQVATPAARSNAMQNLFTREGNGIGVSFLRNPMGASDLARWHYSYADLPAGQTDTNLASFSIAHDQADIIPLLLHARQLNPQLTIMATPWSPPGWMKTSGSMIGGELLSSMYRPYALYFVKYIQAYQALGIPIHYISLQNEPLYVPGNYPGMSMSAAIQRTVLRDYVLPALISSNLTTKVLVYDHNWDVPDYPDTVLSDATLMASPLIAGTAWHGYGGTPGAMLTLANKFPTKGNYQSEHSGGTWVSDQVKGDFREIIHVMRSSGKAYVKWGLVLNENHGPNAGGCDTCNGLVTINSSSGALTYNIDFYTLGHFSKFVFPGAHRVYSGNAGGIITAAFLNPNGSKALVAFNDTPNNKSFQARWGDRSFTYTLPAYAGATFTWEGTQEGGYTLGATNQIRASSFNTVSGLQTEETADTDGGYNLGYCDVGDYAIYENVDFSSGFTNVAARLASSGSGGAIELRYDGPNGPLIGSVTVPVTGGWQSWQTVTGTVTGAYGLRNLCVAFKGGYSIGNFNWLQFGGPISEALALPLPWSTADIGSVGWAGSATWTAGTFTVRGSGADIESTADEFRCVHQPSNNACEIRARVLSIQNTHEWAKAGLMIRESADPGAPNAAVFITPSHGVTFQRRTAVGGSTASTVIGGIIAPCWLRLSRSAANTFVAYYSSDAVSWIQIGSSFVSMGQQALAGMAVTSHNDNTIATATFESVSLNHPPALQQIQNQSLVAGQTLNITPSASDRDLPPQTLAYSLIAAPDGVAINPGSGSISWRPTIAQSPNANAISIAASDNGMPSMSATQTFVVTVSTPVAPVLSGPAVENNLLGLWIAGDAGPDYMIQASTNLVTWVPLTTLSPAALPCYWADTNNPAMLSRRFYRVVLGP